MSKLFCAALHLRATLVIRAVFGALSAAPTCLGDQIKLSSGEVLTVQIKNVTAKTVQFVHPVLGELTLPRSAVTILPPTTPGEEPPKPAEAKPAVATAPAEPPPPSPPPPLPPPKEWKFKFVLGAGAASGNTDNANVSTLFGVIRETPRDKLALDTGYFFNESNGNTSENRFTIGGRNDWLNPEPKWFYFADLRFDYDEFQSWDERVNGHVGVGYRLIAPPKLTVNLLAGMGFVKEWGSANDDIRPEALLGVEGKYGFAEKNTIGFNATYYPDLSDFNQYRLVGNLGWSYLLDTETKLSLTAGLHYEYQSDVDPGRKHNDAQFLVGLQLDF